MTTADVNGIAATDTLPTEEIVASIVNNTVGGIDSGTYVGNNNNNFSRPVDRDADASTIALTVNRDADASTIALTSAMDNDSNFGVATTVASVGADNYIKDARNNSCSSSRDTSVDLFSPPFQNGTTTEYSTSHPSTNEDVMRKTSVTNTGDAVNGNKEVAVKDSIKISTINLDTVVSTVNDIQTSISETKSVELVSPPSVECTTFNQQITKGKNIIRTPKRPKVISIEGYASNTLSSTQDNASSSTSIHQDSTASSTSSLNCDNSLLKKISTVIPYPIKIWRRTPTETPSIVSFLDIVDLTSNSCCGYTHILRMVDPVHRYGHAVVLKSHSKDDVCYSLSRLMMVVRIQPTTLYFSQSLSYLKDVSERYPKTNFECHEHSEAMSNEREIFLMQLQKWIANEKNWVTGVAVIQAVSNTMPIRPAKDQPN